MDIAQHILSEGPNNLTLPDSLEDEIDDEPPPLQYARSNGLARDHLADQLVFSELVKLQTAVQHGLADDSELPQLYFGSELKVEERVTISREGAQLLSCIAHEDAAEAIDTLVFPMLKNRSIVRRNILELPLLKTDHETDCRNFARRDDFEIKLCDIKLPLEMVNEENNEGLVWPSRFSLVGRKVMEELKQEKMGVSRDILNYLQDALKNQWTEEDDENLWDSEQKYKRNTALEPVTPPLSPLPTPWEPYEPSMSDPAFQLPILSDASSPTKYVLEALEQKIFEQDVPTPLRQSIATAVSNEFSTDTYVGDGAMALGEIYSPLASLENSGTPPSIDIQRMKRENLKVEEPLTPEMPQAAPRSVHFNDIVEEMDQLYPASAPNSPAYENKFFEEAFGDALKIANQRTEQERLIEADSTARVDVPIMDFSKPDPPWKAFEKQRESVSLLTLQQLTIQELVGPQRPWTGLGQVVTHLNWVPFPTHLARVALEEPFQDDDSTWEAFVKDLKEDEVIDSSNLTWKPAGLKIVNDEDDDDEIEPGKFLKDNVQNLSSLIKKRKMELDQGGNQDSEIHTANGFGTKTSTLARRNTPRPNNLMPLGPKVHDDRSHGQGFGLLGGAFSAANSIDNYLEVRGTKKPKLMDSLHFQPALKAVQPMSESRTQQVDPKTQTTIPLPIRKSPVVMNERLPVPTFQPPNTKTYVIVSSTLLKHRKLIKNLEGLLSGGLELVERDFSAHNITTWMPGSVSPSPIKSPLDSEADIIVSPSMGITITTLQKIKQRPLPGQKAKSAIRERLEQVSTRYEKLAVYVSEGRADETTNGLDANDGMDLASFVGFASGLSSSITVQFVGGGEETLSKWLASSIAQNRVAGDLSLIEEETHWELFLRRAGMNAFAAQAIISEVKEPDGVNPLSPSKVGLFGMVAFVKMTLEQRIARFGPICGRGLIERSSAVIDTDWRI